MNTMTSLLFVFLALFAITCLSAPCNTCAPPQPQPQPPCGCGSHGPAPQPPKVPRGSVTIVDATVNANILGVTLSLDVDVESPFTLDLTAVLSSLDLGITFQRVSLARFLGHKGEIVAVDIDIGAFSGIEVDFDLDVSLGHLVVDLDIDLDLNLDVSVVLHTTVRAVSGVLNLVGDVLGSILRPKPILIGAVSVVDMEIKANVLGVTLKLDSDIGCGFTIDVLSLLSCKTLGMKFEKAKQVHFGGIKGEIAFVEIDISAFTAISLDLDLDIVLSNLILDLDLDVDVNLNLGTVVHTTVRLVDGVLNLVGNVLGGVLGVVSGTAKAAVSILETKIHANLLSVTLSLDSDCGSGFSLDVHALLSNVLAGIRTERTKGCHFVGYKGEVMLVEIDISDVADVSVDLDVDIDLLNLDLDLDVDIDLDISSVFHGVVGLVGGVLSLVDNILFSPVGNLLSNLFSLF